MRSRELAFLLYSAFALIGSARSRGVLINSHPAVPIIVAVSSRYRSHSKLSFYWRLV